MQNLYGKTLFFSFQSLLDGTGRQSSTGNINNKHLNREMNLTKSYIKACGQKNLQIWPSVYLTVTTGERPICSSCSLSSMSEKSAVVFTWC